ACPRPYRTRRVADPPTAGTRGPSGDRRGTLVRRVAVPRTLPGVPAPGWKADPWPIPESALFARPSCRIPSCTTGSRTGSLTRKEAQRMDDITDRREERALRRFLLIADALDPDLADDERPLVIARLIEEGIAVDDDLSQVSRATIYRWLKAYREGRMEALKPRRRKDAGTCRALPERILKRAVTLRHILKSRDTRR